MRSRFLPAFVALLGLAVAHAQGGDLRVPEGAVAGNPASISTGGSGSATFYLVGPAISIKRDVKLGENVTLAPQNLQISGRYLAIVCADNCKSAEFFVAPATPASLTFLVHPSRAAVGKSDVISGVVLPFDEFHNLVIAPATAEFQLSAGGKQTAATRQGVAWFRTNSGKMAGALQVTASIHDVSARRVVQQVASDPCALRIKGQRATKGVVVETEPVRDCAGNPVPDGTIVTFTAKAANATDTVDAPIKKGIARAQMTGSGPITVSAASGVVMGNALHLEGQ
jgi:hypothetical protein